MAGRRERQNQIAREAFAARAAQQAAPEAQTPEAAAAPARAGSSPAMPDSAAGAAGASPRQRTTPAADTSAHATTEASVAGEEPRRARFTMRRRQAAAPSEPPTPEPVQPGQTQGKGRPTPKRRDAEAANRRPVVVADRKEARKQQRAAREAAFQRQQEGIARGDERYFMPRDRGPARAYVRDVVDARWNPGELMLPVAVIVLLVMFLQALIPDIVTIVIFVTYFILLAGIVDSVIFAQIVKRRAVKKFGADAVPKWSGWYAGMRALQVRRLRQPKPRVKRGAKID